MLFMKDINIICHYPRENIGDKVSKIQSETVIRYISNMNTEKENKIKLIDDIIKECNIA